MKYVQEYINTLIYTFLASCFMDMKNKRDSYICMSPFDYFFYFLYIYHSIFIIFILHIYYIYKHVIDSCLPIYIRN